MIKKDHIIFGNQKLLLRERKANKLLVKLNEELKPIM